MPKKIILFCLLLGAVLFGLEKTYHFLLFQNKNIKASYVLTEPINADLLIHGPCEPLWMLNPTQLDTLTNIKSYNLALSHSNFADNYIHLNLYLKNNKKPDYLLLYVTPESMDERFNTFNTYRFAHLMSDTLVANIVKEFDPDYKRFAFFPFVKYAYYSNFTNFKALQGFKHCLKKRKLPFHPNGYEPPVAQDWHFSMKSFIDLYPEQVEFVWSKRREKYLRKIIAYAKAQNIPVVLYESPVFEAAKTHQVNRYEMLNRIQNLADELNVPLWLFDDLEMAKDQRNFFSTLNTTVRGSEIFTDTLGRYFKKEIGNIGFSN